MYDFNHIFLNLIMVITTVWTVNKYLNIFLEKKENSAISILLWLAYFIFQFFIQCNVGKASIWITIVGITIVSLISFCNFYSIGIKNLYVIFFHYVIGVLVELILLFFMNFLQLEVKEANTIGQVVSKIIMIIIVYILFKFWKKDDISYVPTTIYCLLFVVPIGSIYIAIQTFFLMNMNGNFFDTMFIFSILLLFNLVMFEIYSKLAQFFTFEKENAIYVQQINIISKNTEEQKKIMENFYKEKHDLVNELVILRHNIQYYDMTTAMNSLNQIIHSYDEKEKISMCGNNIIDAIINFKYTLAKEKKINFLLKLFIPEVLPFDQCDLGIAVGNGIDNAIEAVDQCINHEKQISIIMGVKKEAFVMVLKNPYENKIKRNKKGNLISTKRNSANHGYGVRAIKKVVEKYNGEMIVETEDNTFMLIVTMNF